MILELFAFVLFCSNSYCHQIIVTSLIVGDSLPNGKTVIAAAHEVAIERVKLKFPKLSGQIEYHPQYLEGNLTCEEAASQMPWFSGHSLQCLPEIDADGDKTVGFILAPGCSLEVRPLADVARERDFVLLASTAVHKWFGDRKRFPTVIAMGPSNYGAVSKAIVAMLVKYQWNRVSVICNNYDEDDKDDPTYNMALEVLCNMIMTDVPKSIAPSLYDTKSSSKNELRNAMLNAASYSSVIVLVTAGMLTSQLLEIAGEQGMGNGKAVFLVSGLSEHPEQESELFQGYVATNITDIRRVLPFTFKIYPKVPDGSGICAALADIRNLTLRKYGVQTGDFETQLLQISAYESAMMMAQVLDENYDHITKLGGVELTKLFLNRSFHVDGETLGISATGFRGGDAHINSYFLTEAKYKLVLTYTADTAKLRKTNRTIEWGGKPFPPSSAMPLCQFTPQGCRAEYENQALYALLVLPAVLAGIYIVAWRRNTVDAARWWLGDELIKNYVPSSISQRSIQGGRISSLTYAESPVASEEATYHGVRVECQRLPTTVRFNDIMRDKRTIQVLKMVMQLEHSNVSKFIGIGNLPTVDFVHQLAVAFEYPAKGTLRQVIDNDDMALSWDLRLSIIWDLIEGLRYVHSTPIRFHCLMNSVLSLVLDRHFTLKIARTGMLQFNSSLETVEKCHFTIPAVCVFWMAPECLIGISEKESSLTFDETGSAQCQLVGTLVEKIGSPASDVYSLGVVLYEIATRNTPYGVNLMDNTDVLKKLQTRANMEPDVGSDEVREVISQIYRQCCAQKPHERPTIEQISHSLKAAYPHNNVNFTENLMNRLQNYHRELETVVGARTEALRQEMRKTDDLLSNLLPSSVAKMLRERSHVPPEFFESVTVLFSDIPAFNDMVANCSPFDIVSFLHHLYSALDEEIPRYDVYKVETIKDSYMLVSGVPNRSDRHACEISNIGLRFMEASSRITNPCNSAEFIKLRIGINSGPVVATVIGSKLPHYCLVGDTVNFASRMESHGMEKKIHISLSTRNLLGSGSFVIEERGLVEIKGKGSHFTFWLVGHQN